MVGGAPRVAAPIIVSPPIVAAASHPAAAVDLGSGAHADAGAGGGVCTLTTPGYVAQTTVMANDVRGALRAVADTHAVVGSLLGRLAELATEQPLRHLRRSVLVEAGGDAAEVYGAAVRGEVGEGSATAPAGGATATASRAASASQSPVAGAAFAYAASLRSARASAVEQGDANERDAGASGAAVGQAPPPAPALTAGQREARARVARLRDYQTGLEDRSEIAAVAGQLAPLLDRFGRILSDLAPHIATLAQAPGFIPAATSVRRRAPLHPAPAAPSAAHAAAIAAASDAAAALAAAVPGSAAALAATAALAEGAGTGSEGEPAAVVARLQVPLAALAAAEASLRDSLERLRGRVSAVRQGTAALHNHMARLGVASPSAETPVGDSAAAASRGSEEAAFGSGVGEVALAGPATPVRAPGAASQPSSASQLLTPLSAPAARPPLGLDAPVTVGGGVTVADMVYARFLPSPALRMAQASGYTALVRPAATLLSRGHENVMQPGLGLGTGDGSVTLLRPVPPPVQPAFGGGGMPLQLAINLPTLLAAGAARHDATAAGNGVGSTAPTLSELLIDSLLLSLLGGGAGALGHLGTNAPPSGLLGSRALAGPPPAPPHDDDEGGQDAARDAGRPEP
jgi:hypothetical protein